MDYLEHQFPEDYPDDKVPEKILVLTEEQKESGPKKGRRPPRKVQSQKNNFPIVDNK